MLRFVAIFILIFFLSSSVFAEVNFVDLSTKLDRFVEPYGDKVGFALVDLRTQQYIGANENREYRAASVIKLLIMACVFYLADNNNISLAEKIKVTKASKLPGSGVLQWMKTPKLVSVKELARMMISISDNTATRLLVTRVGMQNINDYCAAIGLKNTRLVDPTALCENPKKGVNVTTPMDMALLMVNIYQGRGYTDRSKKAMLASLVNQRYRWGIVKPLSKGTWVANKTGNLTGVLNDVAVVNVDGRAYVLSVFTEGFTKKKNAREIINGISKMVYDAYLR